MSDELRKHYFKKITGEPRAKDNQELKLKILFSENTGSRVYKYSNVESAIKSLSTSTLLLQQPEKFNDPFDCLAQIDNWDQSSKFAPSAADTEFVKETLLTLPQKFQPKEFSLLHDLRNSYTHSITCFSSDSKNLLMWSHYANQHRGVCLEYEMTEMKDNIHPCFYTDSLEGIDWSKDVQQNALVKFRSWHYKTEWRDLKKTSRTKMRLIGSVLGQIYNAVHTSNRFNVSDFEEWSTVSAKIISDLETLYAQESILRIKPKRLILGTRFSNNFSNETIGSNCNELISSSRKQNIPIFRITATGSSFELKEVEVFEPKPNWIDLNPHLKNAPSNPVSPAKM